MSAPRHPRPVMRAQPRPYEPRYRVTPRGEAVLRVGRAMVTIIVCSMALAALAGIVLAWLYNLQEVPTP